MEKLGPLQYDIEESLGKSTLLVKYRDGQRKIVKQWTCADEDPVEIVNKIKEFAKTTEHTYFADVEDAFVVGNTVYLISQYCEGGSLHALIKRARQYEDVINEREAVEWLIQMTLALTHLHAKGLVFGELNPKNIFLSNNCCKLSSAKFISRQVLSNAFQSSTHVTPYTCPDSLSKPDNPTAEDDAWSLGCVLFEICALKKLFPETKTDEDLMEHIAKGRLETFPQIYSKEISSLWSGLLSRDPKERLSLSALLKLPFISEYCEEMEEMQRNEGLRISKDADESSAGRLTNDEDSKLRQLPDARDDIAHFRGDNDDLSEDDESNYLTSEDIDQLLNSLENN